MEFFLRLVDSIETNTICSEIKFTIIKLSVNLKIQTLNVRVFEGFETFRNIIGKRHIDYMAYKG
jgi:hypothetical protein